MTEVLDADERPECDRFKTVTTSLRVLEAVARHQPATSGELSKIVGVPEWTVRRTLAALNAAGWLRAHRGRTTRWEIGARVLADIRFRFVPATGGAFRPRCRPDAAFKSCLGAPLHGRCLGGRRGRRRHARRRAATGETSAASPTPVPKTPAPCPAEFFRRFFKEAVRSAHRPGPGPHHAVAPPGRPLFADHAVEPTACHGRPQRPARPTRRAAR
ncbi:helix-turn-helix domain-containing protein [Streptomyces sp. NPDC006172]|uniref:helix-turn-helix domain-containing protein n=1 Tax=Streptomyces sp. NPDC006172 TaxID=3154470 RepID=UPI0033D491E3